MDQNKVTFLQVINNNPMILIAILAVVTPVFTSIVNGIFSLKMKRLEMQSEINRNVLYKEIDILLDALNGLGNISGARTFNEIECAKSSSALMKAIPYTHDIEDEAITLCLNLRSSIFPDKEHVKQISDALSTALSKASKAVQ